MDAAQCSTLAGVLERVPDPRARRGRRYAWSALLTLIVAGLASGQVTPSAIGQWVREHAEELRPICGRRVPSEATLRRALARTEAAPLEEYLAHLAQRAVQRAVTARASSQAGPTSAPGVGVREARALDGKTVRGVGKHGVRVHLVSEVTHVDGLVVQQQRVDERSNEIPCVQAMLRGRDLAGILLTLDAQHTQRATARLIVEQHGHYLMIVKANQPDLYEALSSWFAEPGWAEDEQVEQAVTVGKGHGRQEWRRLERRSARQLALLWPGARQALRRHCVSVLRTSGQQREEVSYALTSLAASAASAAQLEHWWRGHWTIENRVHYVRDVTWQEDAGQARVGQTCHVLAALRNGLLNLLRGLGHTNIAAALRHYGASVERALRLIGLQT